MRDRCVAVALIARWPRQLRRLWMAGLGCWAHHDNGAMTMRDRCVAVALISRWPRQLQQLWKAGLGCWAHHYQQQ